MSGLCYRLAVLKWGDFIPQGTFGNAWRHLLQLGGGERCCWHVVGGDQGSCSTARRAQDAPHQRVLQPQMSDVLRRRNPDRAWRRNINHLSVHPSIHLSTYGCGLQSGMTWPPRGHITMSGDIFCCHTGGRGCSWHVVGGDQGSCSTPRRAQHVPHQRVLQPQMSVVLRWRKPPT